MTFAGIRVAPAAVFPYLISLSLLCRFLLLPHTGLIADASNWNKRLLVFFAYLGAISTTFMYWLGDRLFFDALLVVAANVSFGLSIAFYNSLLPRITTEEERESVSCWGWAIGFLGGGIVLAAHLALLERAPALGLTTDGAVRISLASSGVWWGLFTIVPLLLIPAASSRLDWKRQLSVRSSRHRLRKIFMDVRSYPATTRFLLANTLYEDGVQTVMLVAVLFGHEELKLPFETLVEAILLVQFVGVLGPLLFRLVARAIGLQRALLFSLACWVGILGYAYLEAHSSSQFFVMAGGVAIALGGTGALSRALFADLIPRGQEAEFFSLREAAVSGTSWLGPFSFGLVLQVTQSYRIAILSPILFFAAGAVTLAATDTAQARRIRSQVVARDQSA
jgi:UMF1 family MFS transporter